MSRTVIIVGAGIIGATTALRLAQAGYDVTICDAAPPGSEVSASYGNGGWISPASIVPMSMPGLWRKLPGYLLNREGPLTIDLGSLPKLTPWLLRFVLAGLTAKRVRRTAHRLNWLICDAPQRHLDLAKSTKQDGIIVQNGLLYIYPDRAAFESEAFSWQLRTENGVVFDEWTEAFLREKVPALGEDYHFAVHVRQGAHCINTGRYVFGIVRQAQLSGARFLQSEVVGLQGGNRPKVFMQDGSHLSAENVIIAAGIGANALLRPMGLTVPMTSERGYQLTVPLASTPFEIPVMPSTGKMANTPTEMGLRLSGQVELAAITKEPNWQRAEILRRHAWATYPYLAQADPCSQRPWMGHRPSTSDGLPVIGAFSAEPRIIAAFGHGHIGIASAPKTADCVLAELKGEMPSQAKAFRPARFGR